MICYTIEDKKCISLSNEKYPYKTINQSDIKQEDNVYILKKSKVEAKLCSLITNRRMIVEEESTQWFQALDESSTLIEEWIEQKIQQKKAFIVNTSIPHWEKSLHQVGTSKKKFRVHLLGLGDVGGTLLTGLKLLGNDVIESIGIYDLDQSRAKRWMLESNQIMNINDDYQIPVDSITDDRLFDCDVFIFTASKFIPAVGSKVKDVRMAQYQANRDIIKVYAKRARKVKYKGLFAVVSDPVDLLCRALYDLSNQDEQGNFDGKGLLFDQIKGYGLGVMNARACYYSKEANINFENGRSFGPHGKSLAIINDIDYYSKNLSDQLTKLTVEANLKVREVGYKPFIAPALSSGAIAIIETLRGRWHYSTVALNGVFFGCKNRWHFGASEIECLDISDQVLARINQSYKQLRDTYENN